MIKNTMRFTNHGSYAELVFIAELIDKEGDSQILAYDQIIQDDDVENVLDTVKYYESQGVEVEYIETVAYKGF